MKKKNKIVELAHYIDEAMSEIFGDFWDIARWILGFILLIAVYGLFEKVVGFITK
jgi:hypothetical protein